MNIYIYGNSDFKREINNLLERANIKFRLDDNSSIVELNSLDELKDAIEENPENIYLIDDSKIIKKKSLNSKFKFLKPKDGIEQEYLLDHGIGDMSVDSLEELTTHIIRKLESNPRSMIDDGVEDSIRDIVSEAYEDDKEYELDDELSSLLTHIDPNEEPEDMDEFFKQSPDLDDNEIATSSKDYFDDYLNEEEKPLTYAEVKPTVEQDMHDFDDEFLKNLDNNEFENEDLSDLDELMNLPLDDYEKQLNEASISDDIQDELLNALDEQNASEEDLSDLDELMNLPIQSFNEEKSDIISNDDLNEKINTIKESFKGENMANEFSELDQLNENDILSALEGLTDNITPSNSMPAKEKIAPVQTSNSETITLDKSSTEELVGLIHKLLNNKTLEITIKIKD
ncbi:hypothetical protein CRU99_00435 [Malaciobacter mytili]|uniref:hypothetical protein n=1 Tax=Malaciobacter mytili TaxID=603050 RepID=UPI00100C0D73|nr:hypothetical protein [Malaciobacter mytili]RXI48872.1 hypothetical protein CRU99_00435 [Malaciobacter mytili]